MKLGELTVVVGALVLAVNPAQAGGLFLPGSGAVSTSRAGAAVASADDGEALSINPAGLAKTHGTTITVSVAMIRYFMKFTRSGTYDVVVRRHSGVSRARRYPTIKNDPKPPLGIGKFQPIPVVALVTDLGGTARNIRLAAGLYAPSGYPFRDMSQRLQVLLAGHGPTASAPTISPRRRRRRRYDILQQESALLLPSLAASYRLLPELDVGARFTAGSLKSKSTVAVWGMPTNVEESPRKDSLFTADVKRQLHPDVRARHRIPAHARASRSACNYSAPISIHAKGDGGAASAGPATIRAARSGRSPMT